MSGSIVETPSSRAANSFEFVLNGERVRVENVPPTTTLLDWLRASGRTGSKCGCAEGDCGACSVALVDRNAKGEAAYRVINSCIAFLPMFAGRELVTVEGLARGGELHPVQHAMVHHYGSQCGYCTPGFVVSMFEGYYRGDNRAPGAIADQLCGNLCRCTGYRAIRDAAHAANNHRCAERDACDPFAQRLQAPAEPVPPLAYETRYEKFLRPLSLVELFEFRAKHPDAKLVAGATELGVELNKKFKTFPQLISVEAVAELTQIRATGSEWRIGAAAPITAIEEALAGEYPSLAKMFSVFASRQIRNRATLGGNLVTASPIGDSAPVLLTLDASVVLASPGGERTVPLSEFFVGYRQTQLRADEVMKEIVLPRTASVAGGVRRAEFQKVSHRRELDISIVAGAFCVETDGQGIVRHARIAYGGVAVKPMRALQAEQRLLGRTLGASLDEVRDALREEFSPISDVRAGAEYRKALVVALWDKFVKGDTSLAIDAKPEFTGSEPWPIDDATRTLRHESAVGHVTGGARYVDDIAQRRPMLTLWPVMSPHARAKILRRDISKARHAAGVVAVLLAEDIPGENNTGPARHDEPLLARDEVLFHRQVVAVVVGDSIARCRAAAALVEIEYEELPAIVGLPAAIAAGSYHTDPHAIRRGDCAAALASAPLRFDGEFSFGGQEHFYLETHAAWAEPADDGGVQIYSSTQHPSEIQAIVSEVLGCARHKVVVQSPRMGGGFGGKETQGNAWAALVALAASRTGRPVRVQLDRDLDMSLTGKRHPFHAKFSVGHDADGLLQAVKVELTGDGGWSLDLSQPIVDRALFHLDNAYYIPAVDFSGRAAKTNVTSHTAFRGFGGPQGLMVIEEIIDRVARRTGLPPEVVRQRNLYRGTGETNRTHYLEDIGDNRIQEIWTRVLADSKFAQRRAQIDAWNREHARIKRGLAVTPVKFGISFTLTHYNQAGAYVLLYSDGTAQVNHGGTEMGQGLNTKIVGIAMRELGLTADAIRMMPTSTDKVPNTSATAASSGADLNGAAVAAACAELRERLRPIAAEMLGVAADTVEFGGGFACERGTQNKVPFAKLCSRAYAERISLAATGYYKTPGIHWDWTTASGRPFHYFACGAAVAEVEVDGYTGMTRVLRVDIVHDVGDSLNPGVDRGQIEGGFVQGMGWLTSEELKWDAKGRLLTHSASTYQIPAISDAPIEFNVTLLPKANQPNTIHGSKAVGEPPLMLAFCVREAIRDAVASFGGQGEVALASPATGEAILSAIQQRLVS